MQLIEHPVDQDACDGNVEPNGQGPACDLSVPAEIVAESAGQRDDDQRNDQRREHGVRSQQRKIEAPHGADSAKSRHAVVSVVPEIADKEERRARHGRKHACTVSGDIPPADADVTGCQQQGAGGIQGGVNGRKIGEGNHNADC